MTLLVGIKCTDGVVIAADSATTFGVSPTLATIAHSARKIDIVAKQAIVAGTGEVGLGQRFKAVVERLWQANQIKGDDDQRATRIAQAAIENFNSTKAAPGQFGALLAFPAGGGEFALCEYQVSNFQPELKTHKCCYVSMGSGQMLADPFLAFIHDIFWKGGPPDLKLGKFAAVWVMKHAIRYAPGFIANPIDVAILSKDGPQLLEENELQEHHTMVEEADRHLAVFADRVGGIVNSSNAPSLPQMEPRAK